MNKAFVKEPDEPDDLHCPRCGSLGQSVSPATITAHLKPDESSPLSSSSCFCSNANCEVVYFDGHGQVIQVDRLSKAVYPKHPDAPICACFGLKVEDVIADAQAGNAAGVRLLIERSKDRAEHCLLLAGNGRCCGDEVQRVFLKHWKR